MLIFYEGKLSILVSHNIPVCIFCISEKANSFRKYSWFANFCLNKFSGFVLLLPIEFSICNRGIQIKPSTWLNAANMFSFRSFAFFLFSNPYVVRCLKTSSCCVVSFCLLSLFLFLSFSQSFSHFYFSVSNDELRTCWRCLAFYI